MGTPINIDKLNDGDELRYERKPGKWAIHIFRDGVDKGILTHISQDETLTLEGSSNNKISIAIPPGQGNDPEDKIPRIELNTKTPVGISGGDFILLKGKAVVSAKPGDMLYEPSQNDGENKRYDKDSITLKYADSQSRDNRTRSVTVSQEAEISFVNPEDKKPFIDLSGSKPISETKKSYAALPKPPQTKAPEPEAVQPAAAEKKSLSATDIAGIQQMGRQLGKELGSLGKENLVKSGTLGSTVSAAKEAADALVLGGTLDEKQLEKFRNSLDAAISETERLSNDPKRWQDMGSAISVKNTLTKIRDNAEARLGITPAQAANRIGAFTAKTIPGFFEKNPDIKESLESAKKAAAAISRGDGTIDREKLGEFNTAMDAAEKHFDTVSKKGNPADGNTPGAWFKRELEEIKNKLNNNHDLKVSLAPNEMPSHALAQAKAAAGALTSYTAVVDYGSGRGQGDKGTPITEFNTGKSPIRSA